MEVEVYGRAFLQGTGAFSSSGTTTNMENNAGPFNSCCITIPATTGTYDIDIEVAVDDSTFVSIGTDLLMNSYPRLAFGGGEAIYFLVPPGGAFNVVCSTSGQVGATFPYVLFA